MSHFKLEQFNVNNEKRDGGEVRIVKLDAESEVKVRKFDFSELAVKGKGSYSSVKAKYGPLAATDRDRPARGVRDNRFSVNPLLRDPLAIEEEERRVIEARVQQLVAENRELARAEGEKKGYQDGLKKGRDEAYEEFKVDAMAALNSFESFVQGFEATKSEIFKANERFLMELVFRVSKMVTLKELSGDADYVLRLARELVNRAGIRDNVKIRINPKDAASIDMLKADLTKTFADLKNLTIEISDTVAGGGCALESQWTAIDASLETQLQGLHEALTGSIEKDVKE